MKIDATSKSRQWLQSIVSISLVFLALVVVLMTLLSLSHDAHAVPAPFTDNRNLDLVGVNATTKLTAAFTTCVEVNGVTLYEGPTLKVTQVLTRIIVENSGDESLTIGASWDLCNPYGIFPTGCPDSLFDTWISPGECASMPIKNHYTAQGWAWDNSSALVDSYDLLIAPPDPALPNPPVKPPARLFIYYGYPSLVNSCSGSVDCAVEQFRHFEVGVFGAGLEDPVHSEHVATTEIISQLHGTTDILGYIDMTLELTTIITSINAWADMGVAGATLDRAGSSDFGVTRTKLCRVVNYAHDLGLLVMVNAWEPDDVLGDDPPSTPTCLSKGDWYLAESWPVLIDQCGYYPWFAKGQKMAHYQDELGVRMATMATSDYGPCSSWPGYPLYRHALWANYLFNFAATGFTNSLYSASGPHANELCPLDLPTDVGLKYLTSPSGPVTIDNIPTYWRLTDLGTIYVQAGGNDTCDGEFIQPTLLVSTYAEPEQAQFGELLTFTIRITNTSPATLTAIMTDILPSQVSPSGILTRILTISPLETREEQIVVTVEQHCGSLINKVEVASQEGASGSTASANTRIDGTCKKYVPVSWKNYCCGNPGPIVEAEDCPGEDGCSLEGDWKKWCDPAFHGGCLITNEDSENLGQPTDARLSLDFRGNGICILHSKRDWYGVLEVVVDGSSEYLNQQGPDEDQKEVCFAASGYGCHSLVLEAAVEGGVVTVDAIRIY
jgi:uncharacterized repeat protein (TIGR01451 family)